MRPAELAGMSKSACSAIECVCFTPLIDTLQNTCASSYWPLVRFRNLNIITFCAGGMLLGSQKPTGDVGVAVGGVLVAVRVAVAVGVLVGVAVAVRVAVAVLVGALAGVAVRVGVLTGVGVFFGVERG